MGTPAGRILYREKQFNKYEPQLKKLAAHRLNANPAKMGASIQRRNALLGQAEKKLQEVVGTGDWALQVFFLSRFRNEQMRFYNDLVQLPPPAGLSAEEQQQYVSLLGQQAQPFKAKGEEFTLKVKELLSNPWGMDGLLADYHNAEGAIQEILKGHVEKIQSIVPEKMAADIYPVARKESKKKVPSLFELEQARKKVQSNPHDRLALESLLSLEKNRGHEPTIQYLQSRLKKIVNGFEFKQ